MSIHSCLMTIQPELLLLLCGSRWDDHMFSLFRSQSSPQHLCVNVISHLLEYKMNVYPNPSPLCDCILFLHT